MPYPKETARAMEEVIGVLKTSDQPLSPSELITRGISRSKLPEGVWCNIDQGSIEWTDGRKLRLSDQEK